MKIMFIGLGWFCLVLLVLAIGLALVCVIQLLWLEILENRKNLKMYREKDGGDDDRT